MALLEEAEELSVGFHTSAVSPVATGWPRSSSISKGVELARNRRVADREIGPTAASCTGDSG